MFLSQMKMSIAAAPVVALVLLLGDSGVASAQTISTRGYEMQERLRKRTRTHTVTAPPTQVTPMYIQPSPVYTVVTPPPAPIVPAAAWVSVDTAATSAGAPITSAAANGQVFYQWDAASRRWVLYQPVSSVRAVATSGGCRWR